MTPIEAQRACLEEVETLSGKPVVVQEDSTLKTHATIRLATTDAPLHLLRYHRRFEAELPYLVSFQCRIASRMLSLPQAEQFDLAVSRDGKEKANQLARKHFRRQGLKHPDNVLDGLSAQLVNGLGTQLRSVPVSLRVDQSIIADFPQLSGQQRRIAEIGIQESLAVLSPNVESITPKKFFLASVAMGAAVAIFWSRVFGLPQITAAYGAGGHKGLGENLLDLSDNLPSEPTSDRRLIEAWQVELKLVDFFTLQKRT